jgi:hypothetical protein
MVKGVAQSNSSNPQSTSSPSTALPTMQTGQNPHDPLTQLNSHLGYGALAGFNPFADLGVNPNDPNMMQTMMQNPQFLQQMSSVMSNPAVLDQIIASNPQLAAIGPEVRQMFQSERFRDMLYVALTCLPIRTYFISRVLDRIQNLSAQCSRWHRCSRVQVVQEQVRAHLVEHSEPQVQEEVLASQHLATHLPHPHRLPHPTTTPHLPPPPAAHPPQILSQPFSLLYHQQSQARAQAEPPVRSVCLTLQHLHGCKPPWVALAEG